MLMFFGIYVVFNSIISLTAFFSRVYAMNVRLKKIDIVKAIFISLFENIGLRTILVYVRFSALLGKRKKQPEWGVIERMEHNKKSTNQGEVKKETSSEKDIA
jgi:hypothetical protein